MREIKFRGKTINGNEWIYGPTISQGTIKRKANKWFMEVAENKWKGLQPNTLGQYTGLKDKNGKEIYEGDILKHSYWDRAPLDVYQQGGKDEYIEEILIVKYSVESGRYHSDLFTDIDIWICEDSEVIGNIYDNPELVL